MESFIKSFLLCVLTVMMGCSTEPLPLPSAHETLTETEKMLTKTWTYDYVIANGNRYEIADAAMEVGIDINALGGNRAQLFRRQIHYSPNGTYQLRWIERGDYSLGTEGDPNWQPNFGYWELDGNILTHNKGAAFAQSYTVTITNERFTRSSIRYMSKNHLGASWSSGQMIQQSEYFMNK